MNRNKPKYFLIALFLFGAVEISFADTDSEIRDLELQKEKLNADLEKMSRQMQSTDSLIRENQKRYEVLEKRYRDDLSHRASEIDTLNIKIKSLADSLQQERRKQGAFKNQLENTQSKRKNINGELASFCRALETQILTGIPWDQESRLERVRALLRDVETGNAIEEEAFARLKSMIGEEIRFGDEVVLINAPVTRKDGEVINARILRIGNQWMVYADENNLNFGALNRREENGNIIYEWNETPDLKERNAIKFAIDVKMARKAPQMVILPLSVSIHGKETK
ncbi:MAG: DUF3450 domain-containing protein [Fibrobacter sp.]|jgi:chromosome segregation ATPase|nr:DUF3450 domain-containing protein [Fibrobacter sp.]